MSQGLFESESEGDLEAPARVEFIGTPVARTEGGGCATVALILLAFPLWPLLLVWLAFEVMRSRKDIQRLIIDQTGISWRTAGSADGRVSLAFAQLDHVEVRRRGTVPLRIVLVPKSGSLETVPDEFWGQNAQGILAELHKSVEVREVDLPKGEVAGRDEVDALAAKGRATGEREEMPDGVRWLAKPSKGCLLFLALLVVAAGVLVNVHVFSTHNGSAAAATLSSCLTLVLAVPLIIGLAVASVREPLELHVTKGGIGCGRPSEPDRWGQIRAEDLEAIHWSEVEGDEGGRSWQLVFKTVRGEFIEMRDFTLVGYGPDICHVASTLHPHVKLALANLPRYTQCRSWPRKG